MELLERAKLLKQADKNPKLQAALLTMCKKDPIYWFNTFCWTTNPRAERRDLPFNLYPYQEWCIQEWLECIDEQIDIGIEKSRDMGASWMIVLLIQYCWLFRRGYSFHAGSRREQEVDNALVDPDTTLFGKFRYNLNKLPPWMCPEYKDKKLSIQNLDNDNIFTGESANSSFGRSMRYRAILFDELAFWEVGDAAYEGCADTTNCRMVLSTPYGEGNTYYRIMHNPENEFREYPEQRAWEIKKGLISA